MPEQELMLFGGLAKARIRLPIKPGVPLASASTSRWTSAQFQPTQQIGVALKLRRRDRLRGRRPEIHPFRAFDQTGGGTYCPLVEYHFKALMLVRCLEIWGGVSVELLRRSYNCTPRLLQNLAGMLSELHRDGRLVKAGHAFTAPRFAAIYPQIPRLPTRGRWRIWEIAAGHLGPAGEEPGSWE